MQSSASVAKWRQGWTDEDWADRESDDRFQTTNFCGGYDADERAFCFSYYDASGNEWWFQVSLPDAQMISAGGSAVIELEACTVNRRGHEPAG